MNRTCKKCTNQELTVSSTNVFRYGVEALKSIVKVEVNYICPSCGQKSAVGYTPSGTSDLPDFSKCGTPQTAKVEHRQAMLSNYSSGGESSFTSVQFPAAFLVGENVLLPKFEGNIQDGTAIDQYGDPDLMLEFSKRYFELYGSIMPTGRLPNSLIEIMPALHLLYIAVELALKAYLIRSDKIEFGHSLQQLYDSLECDHRTNIELRFAESNLNKNLRALGLETPTVKAILRVYDSTYGGASKVYMDSRYYAEPTTNFKLSSGLHGANLIKSHNPYPIFLPEVVRALIETYRFFSGHERLRRLGGDVKYGAREPGNDNHGGWGLIPSSLNLIVLSIPQPAGISAEGENLKVFEKLLSDHPPNFRTKWMYGGNTLLFYGVAETNYTDGHGVLNGVECRIWRNKRLGLHSRDLYLLANVLENEITFESLLGTQWVGNTKL